MFLWFFLQADNLIVDDEIQLTLEKIVKKLSKAMGLQKYRIPVYLVDIDEANASAVSKGAIVLYTGLIAECKTPEEFVGVIAHELGHIKKMHIIRFADTTGYSMIMNGSFGLGAILAPFTGGLSLLLPVAGISFAHQEFLRQMRADEFEADQIAIETLKKMNWPVSGMQAFFTRLMENDFLIRAAGMTTHPLSRDRLQRINDMTKGFKGSLDPEVVSNYKRIRSKVLGYMKKNTNASDLYERALALYATRRFGQSVHVLDQLLKKDKNDVFYQEMKADALFLNGQVKESAHIYKAVMVQHKNLEYVPLKWVSCAIISKSNLDEALNILSKERFKHPTSPYLWYMTGYVYSIKNNEKAMWFCRCQEAFLKGDKNFVKKNIKKAEGVTVFQTLYQDLKMGIDKS